MRIAGRDAEFPAIDRTAWFEVDRAVQKLAKGQVGFIDDLCRVLNMPIPPGAPAGAEGESEKKRQTERERNSPGQGSPF